MTATPHPQEVRDIVVRVLAELGVRCPQLLKETILVDRGRYMARSYRLHGFLAMWYVQDGVVRFFDAQRRLLRTINLLEELVPQRMAA